MKRWIAVLLCLLFCIAALPVSAADVSAPSPWAEYEVGQAIAAGLVPEELQSDYQQDITREEFAQLAVRLCMVKLRYTGGPEQFLEDYRLYFRDEAGRPVAAVPETFSDAAPWGTVASALGIAQGRGDGTFDPEGLITRQEAATMLWRTYRSYTGAAELEEPVEQLEYRDKDRIPAWAAAAVSWADYEGVMEGDSSGSFIPQGHLSREQAILTIYRLNQNSSTTYGLVPYEEELARILFPKEGGFSQSEMVESESASALLGDGMDGTPALWVVFKDGGRVQLWPVLEKLVPGMTGVDGLSITDETELRFRVTAVDGTYLFRLPLFWGSAGNPVPMLSPLPWLEGKTAIGFDGAVVSVEEGDGMAVYRLSGEQVFTAPMGVVTCDEESGVFRHEGADGIMYYTSEGQLFRQKPWALGTEFYLGECVVQETPGGPVQVLGSDGAVLRTLDSFGGTIAEPTYDGGYGGNYVLLDKDNRHYLLNTTDGSLFGGEYLDVGPFVGTHIAVKDKNGWGFIDQFLQSAVPCQYQAVYPFNHNQVVVQKYDGTFTTVDGHGKGGTIGSGWTALTPLTIQGYALGVRTGEDGTAQTMLISLVALPAPLPGERSEYALYGATAVRTAGGEVTLFGKGGTRVLPELELEGAWGTADSDALLLKADGTYYVYQAP